MQSFCNISITLTQELLLIVLVFVSCSLDFPLLLLFDFNNFELLDILQWEIVIASLLEVIVLDLNWWQRLLFLGRLFLSFIIRQ